MVDLDVSKTFIMLSTRDPRSAVLFLAKGSHHHNYYSYKPKLTINMQNKTRRRQNKTRRSHKKSLKDARQDIFRIKNQIKHPTI